MQIRIRRPWEVRSSEITDPEVYRQRRRFMQGSIAAGAGLLLSGCGNAEEPKTPAPTSSAAKPHFGDLKKSSFSTDEKPTPLENITHYNNFYELGTGKRDPSENAAYLKPEPWTIKVTGACAKPATYQLEDFVKPHALEERIYRLRCVEAWSMVIPWVGFPLAEVIKRAEPTSAAKYVAFETLYDPKMLPGQRVDVLEWPYREGLRMDEAMHPLAMLAVGLYGDVLPNQDGAPIRLVVPWKYGFKNIKSIVSMRFVEEEPKTSWNMIQPSEYGFYSNVNPQVDHPRWSQASERRIGEFAKRETLMFNGYADAVASLYSGMDLAHYF